jgi:hypothetical protein
MTRKYAGKPRKASRYVKSEMVNREKNGMERGKASRPLQNVCAEFPDSLAGKFALLCVLGWFCVLRSSMFICSSDGPDFRTPSVPPKL